MKPASFPIAILLIAFFVPSGAPGATGLYQNLPAFFAPPDTSRQVSFGQTECDLRGTRASLLAAEIALRPAKRVETRLEIAFPALRGVDEIVYGVGDMTLRGALRLAGDSLGVTGVFLRGDVRFPTGSKSFRPFSNGSLEIDGGFEARVIARGFALRGAALHTIAGEKTNEPGFADDTHLTLAASASIPIPAIATAGASLFVVRFDRGGSRQIAVLSADRRLSSQLALQVAALFETGPEAQRIFDACGAVTLRYRFPPRVPATRPAI